MNSHETAAAQLYLRFFQPDEVEAIAHLVEAMRARRESFVQQWRELYASLFGAHRGCSEQLFRETYVPYLHSAVLRLSGGDADGFSALSAVVGEHLATSGVPFSVLVAHLNLLKESCTVVFSEQVGELTRSTRLTIDKLAACCISAAADGYYRGANGAAPGESAARPTAALAQPAPPPTVFHGMMGRSPGMQRVFGQIRRLAAGTSPVLIAGETGTGKELIARAIHNEGPRRGGPFVAVNCAALPRDLIESELFGHKRGAFSGAASDHLGLFPAASAGTLLLDEITEMSPELQAKLLRVVQERTVRPVGAINEVPVDVRIIASTNRDPHAVVACGALRSDLYYRLCVSLIVVPPLRERGDDIQLLAGHYLGVLNERYGHTVQGVSRLSTDTLAELMSRAWPGNVRELFNVLEDTFATCPGADITSADLTQPAPPTAAVADAVETFADSERALIARALSATQGNKLRAAQQLGISRKKLYAKLAKYALPVLLLSQTHSMNTVTTVRPPRAAQALRWVRWTHGLQRAVSDRHT